MQARRIQLLDDEGRVREDLRHDALTFYDPDGTVKDRFPAPSN